jgi:HK97 family phage portal protein
MRLPWQAKEPEKRTLTEADFDRLFERTNTKAGANVTTDSAIYSAVVAACIMVRAEAKATLPVHVFRDDGNRRVKASERPEYMVLKSAWNPHMTAAQGWLWQSATTDSTGNAYALIERKRPGMALYPLIGETLPVIETRKGTPRVLGYKHRTTNRADWEPLTTDEVLHFPSTFISSDGVTGRSLVDIARESIGLDLASEQFLGSFLANGTHFGNVLSTDQDLTANDIDALKLQLADGKGVAPAHKARFFHKGLKFLDPPSSMKDNDLVEQRRYNIERICGIFHVPLVKVAAMWFGTYSNTEQGDLDFAKGCIVPMCVTTEQVLNARLFPDGEHYVKFDLNGLMRGDFATRMQGYFSAVGGPIMTQNEAREREELDPREGGDELLIPFNMTTASQMDDVPDEGLTDEQDDEWVQSMNKRGLNGAALLKDAQDLIKQYTK